MYQEWKAKSIGKPLNPDGVFGQQCVDVVTDYIQFIYKRPWNQVLNPVTGAKELFDAAHDQYFEKIRNNHADPNQLPRQGDICVYDGTKTNLYGHCGVVEGADHDGVMLIQQDGSNDPNHDGIADGVCFIKYRPWRQSPCIGWLRPKINLNPPPPAPTPPPPVVPVSTPKIYNVNTIDSITYEAKDVKTYYVTNLTGANLWDFGHATTWRDFKLVKHFDYGQELTIAGLAKHPIPPKGAEYWMRPEDFGDFRQSGIPAHTYGFNDVDISQTKPGPLPTLTHTEPVPAPEPEAVPVDPRPAIPISTEITEEGPYKGWKAGWYYGWNSIIVPDLTEKHNPIKMPKQSQLYAQGFIKKWDNWYAVLLPGKKMLMDDGVVRELTMAQRESYRFIMPLTNVMTKEDYQNALLAEKIKPEDQTDATRNETTYGKILTVGGVLYALHHKLFGWLHKTQINNINNIRTK